MSKAILGASLGGLPVQLDLSVRDYDQARAVLFDLLARLTPEWTDFYPGDPGVALAEGTAFLFDLLSYHNDRVRNEGFLRPAQRRDSVVNLLRGINYELTPRTAASVDIRVNTSAPGVVLPAGWTVRSRASSVAPAATFELLEATTLVDSGYSTVTAYHGSTVGLESLGASDGTARQKLQLAGSPLARLADGSAPVSVFVAATEWTYTDSFLGMSPTDQVFRVEIQENESIWVIFSDGINGAIPTLGAPLEASYRVGGGSAANSVGVGTIVDFDPVTGIVAVTNLAQPSSGSDRETLSHAKQFGPRSLRALDRAVTLEDYETHAVSAGGVEAAKARWSPGPLDVTVAILASGANPVPTGKWYPRINAGYGQLGAIGRYLSNRSLDPRSLHLEPAVAVTPYLKATIHVLRNVKQADAQFEVERQLIAMFAVLRTNFGVGLPESRVAQVIESTFGVDYVDIEALHRVPAPHLVRGSDTSFADVSFAIPSIYEGCQADTYTMQWLNAQQFRLVGSSAGVITDDAGAPVVFSSATGDTIEVSCTIANLRVPQFSLLVVRGGTHDPSAGDRWTFSVDDYRGNLNLNSFEVLAISLTTVGELDSAQFSLAYRGGIG